MSAVAWSYWRKIYDNSGNFVRREERPFIKTLTREHLNMDGSIDITKAIALIDLWNYMGYTEGDKRLLYKLCKVENRKV